MTATILNLPERKTIVDRIYSVRIGNTVKLRYFMVPVSAGFPSPADDYEEESFDFNEQFLKNAPSSFVVKVSGNSMVNAGINSGDNLVIDKSLKPVDGDVVLAVINGENTLKIFRKSKGRMYLEAANPAYPSIELAGDMEASIWGVARSVHRTLKK